MKRRLTKCKRIKNSLLLNGSKDSIAGITQAWADVGVFVELTVKRANGERNVRIGLAEGFDALWGGDDADEMEVFRTMLFQETDGVDRGAAGGEHRVDDVDLKVFEVVRELAIIFMRLMGDLIAVKADMADAGGWDKLGQTIDHAHAGTEDWDEAKLAAANHLNGGLFDRSLDLDVLGWDVAKSLITLHDGDFLNKLTEFAGRSVLITKNGDLVSNERVFENCNVWILFHRLFPFWNIIGLFGLRFFNFFSFLGWFLILEDEVHDDAEDHSNRGAGDGDGGVSGSKADGETADASDEDGGSDEDVFGVAEVDFLIDEHLDAGGGDEAVKNERDAAGDAGRDGLDNGHDRAQEGQ